MPDANTERLQALSRLHWGRDLNGGLRAAAAAIVAPYAGLDANGIARARTGKDLNASYQSLVDLLTPGLPN